MPERVARRCADRRRVRLSLELIVRPYAQRDLEPLEWFGAFRAHRAFIAEQYERHLRGENVMLVAAHRDFPVGQVWIDLARAAPEGVAMIWALRVLEPLQGLGLGRRLLVAAEEHAREAGCDVAEIGVEKHERAVRALYERLGYGAAREERAVETYVTPDGDREAYVYDQWILRKRLEEEGP